MKIFRQIHRAVTDSDQSWIYSIESVARQDLLGGLARWRLWNFIALSDIKRRYRRTRLGPFWTSLSLLIFVTAIGVLYATLWRMPVKIYLPYLTAGLMVWWPIATTMNDSAGALLSGTAMLRQMRIPISVFIFAQSWKNIIIFGHHMVVFCLMILVLDVPVNLNTLLVIPAIFLVGINGVWLGIFLGMVCCRFRDVQILIPLMLQVLSMLTPIFYPKDLVPLVMQLLLVYPNVFFHFADIVRSPLLGQAPELISWGVVLAVTVIGWTFTIRFLNKYRKRVIYWL